MLVLNFTHPLTTEQRENLARLLGATPEERAIPVQIDQGQPIGPQVAALADAAGLSAEEWQTRALLVHLPGLAIAAAALLSEIHGRAGHFPAVLRLRPVAGQLTTSFSVAEIVNLQNLRDQARTRRW